MSTSAQVATKRYSLRRGQQRFYSPYAWSNCTKSAASTAEDIQSLVSHAAVTQLEACLTPLDWLVSRRGRALRLTALPALTNPWHAELPCARSALPHRGDTALYYHADVILKQHHTIDAMYADVVVTCCCQARHHDALIDDPSLLPTMQHRAHSLWRVLALLKFPFAEHLRFPFATQVSSLPRARIHTLHPTPCCGIGRGTTLARRGRHPIHSPRDHLK